MKDYGAKRGARRTAGIRTTAIHRQLIRGPKRGLYYCHTLLDDLRTQAKKWARKP